MAPYSKILLALDFFDDTEKLCQQAQLLAEKFGAEVHYVHVVELALLGMQEDLATVVPLDIQQEVMNEVSTKMQQLAEQHGVAQENLHIEQGVPKKELLRVAQELGIDLIVTGSHGRHGIGLLLGSTANALLHGASCDVLAVRLSE